MKKTLVLLAHPSIETSTINTELFDTAQLSENISTVNLYKEYPDFKIDIKKEQQRLVEHDVIIFMFPVYWYSTPSLLKEWQDTVLEYGFAYGSQGNKLKNKLFLCAISTGSNESAYRNKGSDKLMIQDLLLPLYP